MNSSSDYYYTTTADNAPASRAARYQDAAAATEGPAVHHVGVQTVTRAGTLESASPSPASPTLSLRNSSSTEPTYVGVRNTPLCNASAAANAPAARPASPPTEDSEVTYSPRAAPVDLRSSPVPALCRPRKALMTAAASRVPREPSPAPPARRRSRVTAPHVQRISAPAHAKHEAKRQAKRDARLDSEDESDGGDAICDYERREGRNVVDDAAARLACARDGADATGVAGSAASAATAAQNDPRRTGVQTVAIPTAALAAAATPASPSAPSPTPSLREGASPGPTAAISCSPRLTPAAGRKVAGRPTRRPASPSLATPVIVDSFFPPQVSPANKRFRAKLMDTREQVSYLVAEVLGSQGVRSDWREREEMLQMQ